MSAKQISRLMAAILQRCCNELGTLHALTLWDALCWISSNLCKFQMASVDWAESVTSHLMSHSSYEFETCRGITSQCGERVSGVWTCEIERVLIPSNAIQFPLHGHYAHNSTSWPYAAKNLRHALQLEAATTTTCAMMYALSLASVVVFIHVGVVLCEAVLWR